MATHVEAVVEADEAADASATPAATSEAAVLKWDRTCHGLYVALFLLTTGEAALLVRKHKSGESGAHEVVWEELTTTVCHVEPNMPRDAG